MKKTALIFLTVSSFIIIILTAVEPGFLTAEKKAQAADRDDHEEIIFKTPDSITLHGWFVRTALQKKGTVIHLSGYPENVSDDKASDLGWLKAAGYDIFEFDYRGSGRSGGTLTLEGMQTDIAAAIETVFRLADVTRHPVFILGQGLGGAFSVCALANSPHKNSVSGLIIDGSFASRRDLRDEKLKTLGLTRQFQEILTTAADDSYSPVNWIKEISPTPVIIIHGDLDTAIPLESGLELYGMAERPKELLIADGKGHEETLGDTEIRKRLISYLDKVN